GEGEAARDVVDEQAEGLVLFFDQLNQLGAKLGVRHGFAALNEQVALTRDRRGAKLAAAVAVGAREISERRTGHFKCLQNSVINEGDRLCRHAFIIKLVVAEQVLIPQLLFRRVVYDAEKVRQNLLADFFREGLSFGDVLLAVTFGAMTEDFVEEDGGSAASQERGADSRIVDGSS